MSLTGGSEFTASVKRAIRSTRKPAGLTKLVNDGATVAEIQAFLASKPNYILAISRKLTHPHLIARLAKMLGRA
jgi:hypothetical protein